MQVRKCGGCDQLFEVNATHEADSLTNQTGLIRTQRIDLCPGCRAGAIERGSWRPEEAKEPPAAEPQEEPAAQPQEEGG